MSFDIIKNRQLPEYLRKIETEVKEKAKAVGLDYWDIIFEILDYDALNEVAAYGGFPTRYPHWKFGMQYGELIKGYRYGCSKIYELVINNDPCIAYLMRQNSTIDQKLVMAHVCGHADFFKNNMWFTHTNKKMLDKMANNSVRIRKIADKYGHDKVEDFIDVCLTLENLIDIYSPYIARHPNKKEDIDETEVNKEIAGRKLDVKRDYMDRYINPPEFLKEQQRIVEEKIKQQVKIPEEPQRDVLSFLLDHSPLKDWESTILEIIREEAYYFAPQGLTKHMNEGWACLRSDSKVFTEQGLITMGELVTEKNANFVYDGTTKQEVYDHNIIKNHKTVKLKTRRGFDLEGSNNHRLLLSDGKTWKRLDEMVVGEKLSIPSVNLWPKKKVSINWKPKIKITLGAVAKNAGVSRPTLARYLNGSNVIKKEEIENALLGYNKESNLNIFSLLILFIKYSDPIVIDAPPSIVLLSPKTIKLELYS